MSSPKIFVPYSIDPEKNPFELYTILCDESDHAAGYEIHDPNKPYIHNNRPQRKECREKLKALKENIFKEKDVKREFHLLRDEEDVPDAVIHDNTQSVFLGLYLTLYQKIKNVQFNNDWTSITVTGDIKIEGENIRPDSVNENVIHQKFKDYKNDISVNDRNKHLFVYVSEKGIDEIKSEGNIKVRHFSPRDPIESVRQCIFDGQYEDELQEFLCTNIRDQTRNIEYIETKAYRNIEADIEEKILNSKIKGCFIWGEGEGGKSEIAEALAKHLMIVDRKIYAPIWVEVGDDLKRNKRDDITLEGATKEYIADKIRKKVKEKEIEISDLEDLQKFLKKNKYILVIDNLEFDNADLNELLQGIKSIIEDMLLNWPYLIITSHTSCTDTIASEMRLELINAPELYREDIEKFFDTIIGSDISLTEIKQKDEYHEFIETLYEHYRSYPGLIIPAIKSIRNGKTIESLLPELKNISTEGIDGKALIIYRAIFSMLDESSQAVLFTLLDKILPDIMIRQDELIKAVKSKAFLHSVVLTQGIAEKALDNLVDKALIYRKAGDKLPLYGIKRVPFLTFMFGDIFAGQDDAEKKRNLRKSLVRKTWRFQMALRHKKPAEIINELEKDIDDAFNFLSLATIYCQEAIFKRNPDEYITKSFECFEKFYIEILDKMNLENTYYYVTAISSEYILQYLQAFYRASKINESWDKFARFLYYLGDNGYWNLVRDLSNPQYQPRLMKEMGDAHYALRFFYGLKENYFKKVNLMYDMALDGYFYNLKRSYSPTYFEATIKEIRATKINSAINLIEWSTVTKYNKVPLLRKAKKMLTEADYNNNFDINNEISTCEYARKEMVLANIYLHLSDHFKSKKLKKKSIISYKKALNIYNRKKERIKHGFAWIGLSIAHMTCCPSTKDINKSIDACKEALNVFHKNDFPMYYAEAMNHLGNAYKALVKEKDDKFFEENLRTFREAEKIVQNSKKNLFIIGMIKHNIGDLHYNYAFNPSHDNSRKADLFRKSIDFFKKANMIVVKYPRHHIGTLLQQGRACLDLAEILPDNEEKFRRLKEATETLEMGIMISIKYSVEVRYDYMWLRHSNALAHERLYKFTREPKDINKALSDIKEAIEYANFKEKERMEVDYSRMENTKAADIQLISKDHANLPHLKLFGEDITEDNNA